jgi:hypothetical protein
MLLYIILATFRLNEQRSMRSTPRTAIRLAHNYSTAAATFGWINCLCLPSDADLRSLYDQLSTADFSNVWCAFGTRSCLEGLASSFVEDASSKGPAVGADPRATPERTPLGVDSSPVTPGRSYLRKAFWDASIDHACSCTCPIVSCIH